MKRNNRLLKHLRILLFDSIPFKRIGGGNFLPILFIILAQPNYYSGLSNLTYLT